MKNIPYALWITPHFTEDMILGRLPPPHINLNAVNWSSLLHALEKKFQAQQQGVTMRIANDAIDQVTVHMRQANCSRNGSTDIQCFDFGDALLAKAEISQGEVIDIQREWEDLHHLENRLPAPPPIMIPLVLSGEVEDIVIFVHNIRHHLRIKAAQDLIHSLPSMDSPVNEGDHQGYLPDDLREVIGEHIGMEYQAESVITMLVDRDLRAEL